jgi:hypothetical protein
MCNVVHRLSFPIAVLSVAWTIGFTAPGQPNVGDSHEARLLGVNSEVRPNK